VLAYLFHRIEDRSTTLLIIDEGWLALDDEGFAGQLREWLKTLRKKNASVIFATQSLSDIDGSAIAPAIIESCQTRLLLPNERAIEPQITAIYRRFGLNDRQIEIIARHAQARLLLPVAARQPPVRAGPVGRRAGALRRLLQDRPGAIARLFAEHGRAGFLAAWLRHRGVGWAADLIPNLTNLEKCHDLAAPARRGSPPRCSSPLSRSPMLATPPTRNGRVRSDQLCAERADGRAHAPADQQPDHLASERGAVLINQARNLASLPYSSLQQLQQSVQRTHSQPGAEHRLRRPADRPGVQTKYANVSMSASDAAAVADAERWQNTVGGLQDAMRVQARRRQYRHQPHADVGAGRPEPVATGALATQAGNQLLALQAQQLADLTAVVAANGRAQALPIGRARRRRRTGPRTAPPLPDAGPATSPATRRCSTGN
jgi:hypothetical protein